MIPIRAVKARVLERYSLAELAEPITLTLSMDEAWSPRIQGEMTIDADAIQWPSPAVEKAQGSWATIDLATLYGPEFTVADLTAAYGGNVAAVTAARGGSVERVTWAHTNPWNPGESLQPLSTATALWGGAVAAVTAAYSGAVERITRALRAPGGSYLIPPTDRLVARLKLRDETVNLADGTISYTLAGDDIRMHDFRRTDPAPWVSARTSLRALVRDMLDFLVSEDGPPILAPGTDTTVPPGLVWEIGTTLWDALHPTLEAVGFELWAGLDGEYVLAPATTPVAPVVLDQDTNLIEYEPSRDFAHAYADGAIVEYTAADKLDPARFDIYTTPNAGRIMHETRPGLRPVAGAAEQLVNRARARGGTATARTLLLLRLMPGYRTQIRPGTQPQYGTIQSLTHDYVSGETTLKLREISS